MSYDERCLAVFIDRDDNELFPSMGIHILYCVRIWPVPKRSNILSEDDQTGLTMEPFTFFAILVGLIFTIILFIIYCIVYLTADFNPKVRSIFPEYSMMTEFIKEDPIRYLSGLWSFALGGFLLRRRRESVLDKLFNIGDLKPLDRPEIDEGIKDLHILMIILMTLFLMILVWIPVCIVVLIF